MDANVQNQQISDWAQICRDGRCDPNNLKIEIGLNVKEIEIEGNEDLIITMQILLQSGASSPAKHGGAYFSAVYGFMKDPIAAPGPYENQEV